MYLNIEEYRIINIKISMYVLTYILHTPFVRISPVANTVIWYHLLTGKTHHKYAGGLIQDLRSGWSYIDRKRTGRQNWGWVAQRWPLVRHS